MRTAENTDIPAKFTPGCKSDKVRCRCPLLLCMFWMKWESCLVSCWSPFAWPRDATYVRYERPVHNWHIASIFAVAFNLCNQKEPSFVARWAQWTTVCASLWPCAVSGGHAVELQQPGSGQRRVHRRQLWIWLHTCRDGSPVHQGPVQGCATRTLPVYLNAAILRINRCPSHLYTLMSIHRYTDCSRELSDYQLRTCCKSLLHPLAQ